MATEAKKMGPWAKFMAWYESYNGKKIVGIVYSLGASVVIVGALFKILHLPGASQMLFAGMMTEALLFAIGCLDKPHPEFHWEEVFPQLLGEGVDPAIMAEYADRPRPNLAAATGAQASSATAAAAVPALDEKALASLKGSIADLAKTAGQLAELDKVAVATSKLGEKAEAAAAAADKYAVAANTLGEKSAAIAADYEAVAKNVAGSVEGTKQYQAAVAAAAKNAAQWSADVETIQAAAAATAKDAKAAEAAQAKLAKQIADLNNIYGNMLTAVA